MSSQPEPKWADLVSNIPDNYSGFERIRFSKPPSKPNWADLPFDIISTILPRLGTPAIIGVAQEVCTSWYNICKDPSMWRVIDTQHWGAITNFRGKHVSSDLKKKMCKHLVDRSQGQLEEIHIDYFSGIGLLHYIADRSSKLKCLKLSRLSGIDRGELGEVLQKLPLLEELSLSRTDINIEDIEVAGRYCPLLKTLKINDEPYYHMWYGDEYAPVTINEKPVAIAKSFPKLLHLQLTGNSMNNIGLEAILDGCPHLESLDLRRCLNINLAGDLGIRCSQQIKYLMLPTDSLDDYKYTLYSSWYNDDYVGKEALRRPFRLVKVISYDDFSESEVEDSDVLENFKFMFERSYKIKMKGQKKSDFGMSYQKEKRRPFRKSYQNAVKRKNKEREDIFGSF